MIRCHYELLADYYPTRASHESVEEASTNSRMTGSNKSEGFLKSAWNKFTHAKDNLPLDKSRFERGANQKADVGKAQKGAGSV